MPEAKTSWWQELATPAQLDQLDRQAQHRSWGLALVLVGWLHLLAFSICYYMTVAKNYHESPGYLAVWAAELIGMGLIFHFCNSLRPGAAPLPPLARCIVRIWLSYLVLAFNLGTMNTLRGHQFFELFPAMASLASFAFLMMTIIVSRRFFAAVLVMFTAGLLISANLLHGYLIFALAWWIVLNGIGICLLSERRSLVVPAQIVAGVHSLVQRGEP